MLKFVCVLILLWASLANAGAISGGGGKGVVCRDPSGRITSAETLDLYEGRVMFGLQIRPLSAPMEVQIKSALATIPTSSRGLIEAYVGNVMKGFRLTPSGAQLEPIDDSFEAVIPRGCAAEQLANYYNDNLILVSRDIWAAMNETDRAALILHEAVYAVNRIVGATESRQSRHVVANLFAHRPRWVDVRDGVPRDALNCMSPNGALAAWAYPHAGGWVLQFHILGRGYVMSKKTYWSPPSQVDLLEARDFPIFPGEDRIGSGIQIAGAAQSIFENRDHILLEKKWEPIRDPQGRVTRGYQTPRYYLSWVSGTYPQTSITNHLLNCSVAP